MEISYRRLKTDEVSLMVENRIDFLKELQGNHGSEMEDALRKELTCYFSSALSSGSYIGWVAEADGKYAGFGGMVIQQIPGSFKVLGGKSAYILNMYTLPDFRKMGICNEIVNRLVTEAREMGLGKVNLHASAEGIGIYRKYGFTEPHMPELEFLL